MFVVRAGVAAPPQIRFDRVEGKLAANDATPIASGSGVVLTFRNILTNCHFVRNKDGKLSDGFRVYLPPDFKYAVRARVIWICHNYDLAVLQSADDLPYIGLKILDDVAPLSTQVAARGFAPGSKAGAAMTTVDGQIIRLPEESQDGDSDDEKTAKSSLWSDTLGAQGDSGSPLFTDRGILVGMNLASAARADKRALAIPGNVISAFLHQCGDAGITLTHSLEEDSRRPTPKAATVFIESLSNPVEARPVAKSNEADYRAALASALQRDLPGLTDQAFEQVASGKLKAAFQPTPIANVKKGDVARIAGKMDTIQASEASTMVTIDGVMALIIFPRGGRADAHAAVGKRAKPNVTVDELYFVTDAQDIPGLKLRQPAIPLIALASLSEDEHVKKIIADEKDRRAKQEVDRPNKDPPANDAHNAAADETEKNKSKSKHSTSKANGDATHATEETEIRTWTSANGSFTTDAKLISYGNGMVTIETAEGKKSKVPIEKLSDADQAYVAKWRKSH